MLSDGWRHYNKECQVTKGLRVAVIPETILQYPFREEPNSRGSSIRKDNPILGVIHKVLDKHSVFVCLDILAGCDYPNREYKVEQITHFNRLITKSMQTVLGRIPVGCRIRFPGFLPEAKGPQYATVTRVYYAGNGPFDKEKEHIVIEAKEKTRLYSLPYSNSVVRCFPWEGKQKRG